MVRGERVRTRAMSFETRRPLEALRSDEYGLVLISVFFLADRHEENVEAFGEGILLSEVVDLLFEVDRAGSEEIEGEGIAREVCRFAFHHLRGPFEAQLDLAPAGLILRVQPERRADERLERFDRELVEHCLVVAQLRACVQSTSS